MHLTVSSNVTIFYNSSSPYGDSRNVTGNGLSSMDYFYTILTAVTSGLSIVGGVCICCLYYAFKDIRTPGRKLLLFLAISDAMLAFGNLLGVIWYLYSDSKVIRKNPFYCKFQSAMTIYFSNTAFFWTVIMGVCLFVGTVMKNPTFTVTYMRVFHVLTWIPPGKFRRGVTERARLKNINKWRIYYCSTFVHSITLATAFTLRIYAGVIVIVALSLNVLGIDPTLNEASWCWIDPRVPHMMLWQMITGKFWEITAYLTTVVLYTSIKCFLIKQAGQGDRILSRRQRRMQIIQDTNRKLTFVPLVFIICRIWGTIRFLLGHFAKDHINEPYITWINPLQGIGDSAQGFANFVLYCFTTEKIRHRLFTVVCPSKSAEMQTETGIVTHSKEVKRNKIDIENNPTATTSKQL